MYISLNIIKEYVDVSDIDIDDLLNRMTLSMAEIDGVEYKGRDIKNVVVGKVISVTEKEDLKKTRLVKVDTGKEVLTSCCGASNVSEGMIVACALPGGSVVGIPEIVKRKVGEYDSECVLCSEKELGISDDHSGILELDKDLKLGMDIKEIYGIDDVIIEIDNKSLTNRPDLWGHYGIAREVAAIYKKPLKKMELKEIRYNSELPYMNIEIKSEKCSRYAGLIIKNVKVKSADLDTRIRLFYCGLRSKSLLVDMTNYVMIETGQPLHAFDRRDIDEIIVRDLEEDIKFTTLDNVERKVPKGTMMICSDKGPIGIAGIMGGANSEIREDTEELIIESASFDAGKIRRSAQTIKKRTDASSRYEKSLDPELAMVAMKRFVKLLLEEQDDIELASNLTDVYPNEPKEIKIEVTREYINRYIGEELSDEFITDSLTRLDFIVDKMGDTYLIKVPSHRATKDISIKQDIVEEVARMYCYDNIVPKPIALSVVPIEYNEEKTCYDKIKQILTEKYAANEIHSYVWHDNDFAKSIGYDIVEEVNITNSEDGYHAVLRGDMKSTMLKVVSNNAKYFDDFTAYEIGSVFTLNEEKVIKETKKLAVVMYSKSDLQEDMFYRMKNIANDIVRYTKGMMPEYKKVTLQDKFISKVISADIYAKGKRLGEIVTVSESMSRKIMQKSKILIFEIDLSNLIELDREEANYKEPSVYQETKLDFNFIVDKKVYYDDIYSYINKFESKILKSATLLDIYEGEKVQNGKKSMTFSITIGDNEKTLTQDEINEFSSSFVSYMNKNNFALR